MMSRCLKRLSLLLTLLASFTYTLPVLAQATAARPLVIWQPRTHPLVRQPPDTIYYPALMMRVALKAVVWVRATAGPDGAVAAAELDHLDSLVVQSRDTAEVARYAAQAQAEVVASAIRSVRRVKLVPAAVPRTFLLRVPFGLELLYRHEPPRPPVRRPQHEPPRRPKPAPKP